MSFSFFNNVDPRELFASSEGHKVNPNAKLSELTESIEGHKENLNAKLSELTESIDGHKVNPNAKLRELTESIEGHKENLNAKLRELPVSIDGYKANLNAELREMITSIDGHKVNPNAKLRETFASIDGHKVKRGVGESPSGMRDSQSLGSNALDNFKRFTNAEASLDPHLDTYPIVLFTKPLLPQFGADSPRVLAGTYIGSVHDQIEREHFKFLNNRITGELTNSNIIPSYTKMFRSMDIPNLGMNLESTVTNKQKERYIQPTFFTGQNGGTINVSMVDDTGLTNMKITKAWYDYIKLVTTGRIMPPEMFASNNIVHYKSSIYILGMSPNFKDIRYFGKFTGVQPSNVPFSTVDFNRENVGVKNFDFEMSYDYFEFLDEELIPDFNTFANILNIRIIKETGTGNYKLEG